MRTLPMLVAVAAFSLPTQAAVAAPPSTSRIVISGFGAVGVVHSIDADGVETTGYLFGVNVLHGQHPDLPNDEAVAFFGQRCYPQYDGACVAFSGAGAADFTSRGLQSGHLAGSVEAVPFCDGGFCPGDYLPPLTFDFDLTFTGVGKTSTSTYTYASGSQGSVYVSYRAGRWRYADVTGTATVDGDPAWVDTAQLMAETSGEFNLVVTH